MKKVILILTVILLMSLSACGGNNDALQSSSTGQPGTTDDSAKLSSESPSDPPETKQTPEQAEPSVDIQQLQSGDDVSIIGQRANSTLVNGNTIWVQVQQSDGTFVIYHCQLKDDFLDDAEDLKLGAVVKVEGLFLSLMESEQDNTSPLVTLYDCEIIE